MKQVLRLLLIVLLLPVTAFSQNLNSINFTVTPADDWTDLFYRSTGWFGGDGIYTIPLNGQESSTSKAKKTLFIFSDTMIGNINNGKLEPGSKMIHNSLAILQGDQPNPQNLRFDWKKNNGNPESVFIPKTPLTASGDYYWLGDGFVNQEIDNSIFIFGYRVRNISDAVFGFEEVGNTLLKIKNNEPLPFKSYEQKDTPFFLSKTDGEMGSFGAGIFVNTKNSGATSPDGYLYLYGTQGKTKKLLVARVKPKDFEAFDQWKYWNGNAWASEIRESAAVTDQVSNELSVSELPDGRYALIFQQNGLGRNVCMRLGKTPIGPFGPVIKLWDTSEALVGKKFYSYNAKAHPSLSKKGELLISYNVNSFDFFNDLNTHPNLYRPRFIRVKFE